MSDPIKRGFWYALFEVVLQSRPQHQIRALKKWILIVAFSVTTFALTVGIVALWFVISLIPSPEQLANVYSSAADRAQSIISDFQKLPPSTEELCTKTLTAVKDHSVIPTSSEIEAWQKSLTSDCAALAPTFAKIQEQTFSICKTQPKNCELAFKNLQATTDFYLASQKGNLSGFDRAIHWFKSGLVMILKENPFLRPYL